MQAHTTGRGRQEARTLQSKLDDDPEVVELRRRLRIPDDGFQDEEEAARWLYDRSSRGRDSLHDVDLIYWPPMGYAYSTRLLDRWKAGIMAVSGLREASRRLRQKCELHPDWHFLLGLYLLLEVGIDVTRPMVTM